MREQLEDRRARQAALFREALALDRAVAARIQHPLRTGVDREALREHADCSEANRILWSVVMENEGLIRKQARNLHQRNATLAAESLAAVTSIIFLGWFRGALRFDPDAGVLFSTYAPAWGKVNLQRANERFGVVKRDSRDARSSTWATVTVDDALGERVEDWLEGGGASPESLVSGREVLSSVKRLPPQERRLVEERVLGDASMTDVAERLHIPRQLAYRVKQHALAKLRRGLR